MNPASLDPRGRSFPVEGDSEGGDKVRGFVFIQQPRDPLSKVPFLVFRGQEPSSGQAVANIGCALFGHHSSLANTATKSPF